MSVFLLETVTWWNSETGNRKRIKRVKMYLPCMLLLHGSWHHTEVASLNLSRSMVELSWNMAKDWKWHVFQHFIPFPAGDWSGASSSDMPAQSSLISLKTCSVSTRHFVHSKSFKIWLLNLRLFKHSVLLLAPQQPPWLHRHLGCKTTSEASAYRRLALALAFDAVVLFCPGIRHNRSRKMWRLESSGYEGKKRRTCGRRPGRWNGSIRYTWPGTRQRWSKMTWL